MRWFAGFFVFSLVALAFLAPWFIPYNFQELDLANRFSSPDFSHIFGRDEQGHDLFIKIIYGGRLSLLVTFSVILLSCILGLFLGTLAGLRGRLTETLIMALADFVLAFPKFLFSSGFFGFGRSVFRKLDFCFDFFHLGGLYPFGSGGGKASQREGICFECEVLRFRAYFMYLATYMAQFVSSVGGS